MRIKCAKYEGGIMKLEKKFSEGFVEDIQELLGVCIDNDMNSVDISIPFEDSTLGIEINFYVKAGKVEIDDE